MQLILLLLIAGAAGYWLASSRFGATLSNPFRRKRKAAGQESGENKTKETGTEASG